MRRFLRNHFWICESLFVLLALLLLVQTSSWAYALWQPRKRRVIRVKRPKEVTKKPPFRRLGASAILGQVNLFHPSQGKVGVPKRPKPVVRPKPKPVQYTTCDPRGKYVLSRHAFDLKATVIADDPTVSMAAIYDRQRHQELWLQMGQSYRGVTICSIEKGRITWLRQGRLEYVLFQDTPGHSPRSHYHRSTPSKYRSPWSLSRSTSPRYKKYQYYRKLAKRYSRYARNYRGYTKRYQRLAKKYERLSLQYQW